MDELGIDSMDAVRWFVRARDHTYILVHVHPASVTHLAKHIGELLRRCYVVGADLHAATQPRTIKRAETAHSKLPGSGSTISVDFDKALGCFNQTCCELPANTIGTKEWRPEQYSTKPVSKTAVVHFVMPKHPHASKVHAILCIALKVKGTADTSTPSRTLLPTARAAEPAVWPAQWNRLQSLHSKDASVCSPTSTIRGAYE